MRLSSKVLRPQPDWAYFLDFDGTLVDIAPTPDSVVVRPAVLSVLRDLQHTAGGAVAVISGRAIAELDRFLTPLRLPCAGLHGLERRPAGSTEIVYGTGLPDHDGLRDAMRDFAHTSPGILVEDKGLTLALHYRARPEAAEEAQAFVTRLAAPLGPAVKIQHGKMVLELKPATASKGTVIEAFMAEAPFAGRLPLFAGDDVTDEDGFAVVNALSGHAVRVGPPDGSAARWYTDSPEDLLGWFTGNSAAPGPD